MLCCNITIINHNIGSFTKQVTKSTNTKMHPEQIQGLSGRELNHAAITSGRASGQLGESTDFEIMQTA